MAQNDIFQLTFIQRVNGTRISNVFYARQEDPNGANDPRQDLAVAFRVAIWTPYQAQLSNDWEGLCSEVRQVGVEGQANFRDTTGLGVGAILEDALPTSNAAIIAQFTATGGRKGTGRTFVSGIPDTYEERNNLNNTGLTALDVIGDAMIPAMGAGVGNPSFQLGLVVTGTANFDQFILTDVRVPIAKLRERTGNSGC